MKTPCALLVPPFRVVATVSGPENNALATAAADIPPSICAMKTKPPRLNGMAPMRHSPRVTCELSGVASEKGGFKDDLPPG